MSTSLAFPLRDGVGGADETSPWGADLDDEAFFELVSGREECLSSAPLINLARAPGGEVDRSPSELEPVVVGIDVVSSSSA